MKKNITIVALIIVMLISTLYHTTAMSQLQSDYKKTCESSVKKSEHIGQLNRQLRQLGY
jgi:cell division protein FtsL